MAIWQYPLRLVPKKASEGRISESQITTDALDKCLPRNKPYADSDSLYWGDEQKTDAAVYYKNGIFVEASIRISLSDPGVDKYFNMALEFVAANDCVILDDEERLIKSNLDALKERLKDSPQFRFVSNPKAYLEKLHEEKNESGEIRKLETHPIRLNYKIVINCILLFAAIVLVYYFLV